MVFLEEFLEKVNFEKITQYAELIKCIFHMAAHMSIFHYMLFALLSFTLCMLRNFSLI